MRKCIWLIAFGSSAALAHGDYYAPNNAGDSQARDRASSSGNVKEKTNAQPGANQRKPADERQRFCVRNHLGRVNCIVYPNSNRH